MNKKYIILAAIIFGIFFLVWYVYRGDFETPVQEKSEEEVVIESYEPSNGSSDVSVHTIVSIVLNTEVSNAQIEVTGISDVDFLVTAAGDTVFIEPVTQWSYSENYQFEIADQAEDTLLGSYTFTTIGDTATGEELLIEHPAQYLAEQTPYGQDSFSVVSDYDTENERFVFLVEAPLGVSRAQSEEGFISWAESHGLTEEQIGQLYIEYFEAFR